MGQSPSSENYTKNPVDNILVQGNSDIQNGHVVPRVWTTQVTKFATKGSMILSVRAPVGQAAITDYDVVLGRGVAGIGKNIFIYYFLERLDQLNYWRKLSTGSTFDSINSDDIKNVTLYTPQNEETNKIGSILGEIDNIIISYQQLLKQYKNIKKSLLQTMFPRDGEKVPKVRFADFHDDWEQHPLETLTDSLEYGLNVKAIKYDGKNKYIRITDIDDSSHRLLYSHLTSPDTDLQFAGDYLLREGDILFARTGASVGKTYLYNKTDGIAYYAGFLIRARIKSKYNAEVIFQNTLTKKYDNFVKITSQRSGQPGINAKEYSSFRIYLPNSHRENIILDKLFVRLDNLILIQEKNLLLYKNIKKFYLQKLFI